MSVLPVLFLCTGNSARVTGDQAAIREACRGTLDLLRRRVGALVALRVEDLGRPSLEAGVREIGRLR